MNHQPESAPITVGSLAEFARDHRALDPPGQMQDGEADYHAYLDDGYSIALNAWRYLRNVNDDQLAWPNEDSTDPVRVYWHLVRNPYGTTPELGSAACGLLYRFLNQKLALKPECQLPIKTQVLAEYEYEFGI